MTSFPQSVVPRTRKLEFRTWDVRLIDAVFGIGKKLGTVKARCLVEAQILADLEFKAKLQPGQKPLVSPAGGGRRRPPRRKP